jgi:hypothetical protein
MKESFLLFALIFIPYFLYGIWFHDISDYWFRQFEEIPLYFRIVFTVLFALFWVLGVYEEIKPYLPKKSDPHGIRDELHRDR